jgi:hypothetical protein
MLVSLSVYRDVFALTPFSRVPTSFLPRLYFSSTMRRDTREVKYTHNLIITYVTHCRFEAHPAKGAGVATADHLYNHYYR